MTKTKIRNLIIAAVTFLLISASASAAKQPKYVFLLIGDGMGVNEVFGTQLYNRATGLGPETANFTQFPVVTLVTTHPASSLLTDSAAS